jgi:hypothetical protein
MGNFWCRSLGQGSCNNLWNAKLFPVVSKHDGKIGPRGIQSIDKSMWLMGIWHEGTNHHQTMLPKNSLDYATNELWLQVKILSPIL